MNGLAILIPVALGMGLLGLVAFFWALKRGQFEDLDTSALDILREDEHDRPVSPPPATTPYPGGDASKPIPDNAQRNRDAE